VDRDPPLTRIAVYHRTLPTSGERVWENVRDWEHLPWLHASTFAGITRLDEGDWGWRARLELRNGRRTLLELVIDDDQERYVSRTLEGTGAGSEIRTRVDAHSATETTIAVEFWIPEVAPERAASLADLYVKLYTRLWDEDEAMMVRRSTELRARRARRPPPAGAVELGTLADVRSRLPFIAAFGGERFRIVSSGGDLVAHAIVCPHRLGPLENEPVVDGRVVCPWHGYAFDVATGRECAGRPLRLAPAPRVEADPDTRRVRLVASGSAPADPT